MRLHGEEEKMADVLQLQDELFAMNEYKRLAAVQQFRVSLHIFDGNTKELRELFDDSRIPPAMFHSETYRWELARRLHNFVAGAFTLVDHARRLYGDGTEYDTRFADYKTEVANRFVKDPLHRFLQQFRQYCLHYKVPPITTQLHMNMTDETATYGICLDRAKLYEWKNKWCPKAESYLAAAGERIDLVQAINQYVQKVHDFYTWVYERLKEIHRTDIDAVQRKQQERWRALGPFFPHMFAHQIAVHAQMGQAPEGMFALFMNPMQLEEICGSHPDPTDRANALVNGITDYPNISEDFRQQIVDVFVRFHQRED
jgi:hypothetical protein